MARHGIFGEQARILRWRLPWFVLRRSEDTRQKNDEDGSVFRECVGHHVLVLQLSMICQASPHISVAEELVQKVVFVLENVRSGAKAQRYFRLLPARLKGVRKSLHSRFLAAKAPLDDENKGLS